MVVDGGGGYGGKGGAGDYGFLKMAAESIMERRIR